MNMVVEKAINSLYGENSEKAKRIRKLVKLNDRGRIIGEDHHRAKLTDDQVDTIRELYEEGMFSYQVLADYYNVNETTIARIIRYERRADTVMDMKRVDLKVKQ